MSVRATFRSPQTTSLPLARLSATVFAEPNPAVIKGVLHAQGRIPSPDVRLPLLPASPAAVKRTMTVLEG